MVQFSIWKKFWKALDLLYLFVVFPVVFRHFPSFSWGGNDRKHHAVVYPRENDGKTTESDAKRQGTPQKDRGDHELSKTFHRLKNGPLLRKLQAFKDW